MRPPQKKTPAKQKAMKRRRRHSPVDERVQRYLLQASLWMDQAPANKQIAQALGVPYATLTASLRRLARADVTVSMRAVNHFKTRFRHEYKLGLTVNGLEIAASDKERRMRLTKRRRELPLRMGGPVELLIEELIVDLATTQYAEHIIVYDAVILHGSSDRDIEFRIVTDDGLYSLGCWVRNVLAGNACIRSLHTVSVGFRYSFNGYSGQELPAAVRPADRVAGER